MTAHAFICDAVRTPFGRNPQVYGQAVTNVIFGCASRDGDHNRKVG